MSNRLKIPHQPPLLFADIMLAKEGNVADVHIAFSTIPSLPMLVEGAAQSCGAFRERDDEEAFIASLKNIKLHHPPKQKEFTARITDMHRFESMRFVGFEIFEQDTLIASGEFVMAVY